MITEARTEVGVSEEMVRSFALGKAESLKLTIREQDDASAIWVEVMRLFALYPNVDAVSGRGEDQNVIIFYKKS